VEDLHTQGRPIGYTLASLLRCGLEGGAMGYESERLPQFRSAGRGVINELACSEQASETR